MIEPSRISKTDLARRARQVVDQARRGNTIIVESYGEEQVVVIDATEYRILRAVAAYSALPPHGAPATDPTVQPLGLSEADLARARDDADGSPQIPWNLVIANYLDGHIDLDRAAVLLALSPFELDEHFRRLDVRPQIRAGIGGEAPGEAAAPPTAPDATWPEYGTARHAAHTQAWLSRWRRTSDGTGRGSG